VCVREREKDRQTDRRERERQTDRQTEEREMSVSFVSAPGSHEMGHHK